MNRLNVNIEINGQWQQVGKISYNTWQDAIFSYDENYVSNAQCKAISISLPVQKEAFDTQTTKWFFDGLLPEGFTRNAVVTMLVNDPNDYISLLKHLGSECLGALAIVEENEHMPKPEYKKISKKDVKALAQEGVAKSAEYVIASHLSLDGASGKVGLYYDEKNDKWFQPMGTAPSTHIAKQSHVRHKRIVVNEQLCMQTAKLVGLNVPNSFILNTGSGNDEDLLFVSQRYDRKIVPNCNVVNNICVPFRLHQEDFAQAMNIGSDNKYDPQGTLFEKMCITARNYCTDPLRAVSDIFDIAVFNWLIGNTDGHIKNFSMLYSEDLEHVHIAPAYDIVSAYCLNNENNNVDNFNFAFAIDGNRKLKDISTDSFLNAARNIGLSDLIAKKSFEKIANNFESALKQSAKVLKDEGYSEATTFANQILKNFGLNVN